MATGYYILKVHKALQQKALKKLIASAKKRKGNHQGNIEGENGFFSP